MNPLAYSNANALQINTVIQCIYGFLPLEDLKNCRRVNKKWNFVAEPLLRKRSKIIFYSQDAINEFYETFANSGTAIPFSSFHFESDESFCLDSCFTVSILSDFFNRQRDTIKEVYFISPGLIHNVEDKVAIENYDISEWISETRMTTLSVSSMAHTNLKIPLIYLASVKKLKLWACKINISNGIKLSPVEISLEWVKFFSEGTKLNCINIKDYFNLEKTKKLEIRNYDDYNDPGNRDPYTTVGFDMNNDSVIDELILEERGAAVNWATSRMTIATLKLVSIDFVVKTEAKIKNLILYHSDVDLDALPKEIEKLTFSDYVNYAYSRPVKLPNLKYLSFKSLNTENLKVPRKFIKCKKLAVVEFCADLRAVDSIVNLDFLPRSVKKLSIQGISMVTGKKVLNLDTLVLKGYCLFEAERILKKVTTKVLVLDWTQHYDHNSSIFKFFGKQSCPETIYLGPFEWLENRFKNDTSSGYVDQESTYYVFENKKGRAIMESDFENMSDLSQ